MRNGHLSAKQTISCEMQTNQDVTTMSVDTNEVSVFECHPTGCECDCHCVLDVDFHSDVESDVHSDSGF